MCENYSGLGVTAWTSTLYSSEHREGQMGVDGELHNNSSGMLSEASETEFLSAVVAVNGWTDE